MSTRTFYILIAVILALLLTTAAMAITKPHADFVPKKPVSIAVVEMNDDGSIAGVAWNPDSELVQRYMDSDQASTPERVIWAYELQLRALKASCKEATK